MCNGCSQAILFGAKPDGEADSLEKIHFPELVKDVKSVAGFSASCQFCVDAEWHHLNRPGCQVQFQNGGLQS